MSLLDLPSELIVAISHLLDDEYCINSFLQTCKRLFLLLNHSLYEHNVRFSHACALEWAAKNGYEATARFALQAGASPNARFYENWLPMALACIHGHADVVKLLLANGVDPDTSEGWCHLDELAYEPEGDDDGCPMILAAGNGHESIVKLLVSHGASPDIRFVRANGSREEFRALNVAAERGHLSIVKYLLQVGCDINIPGWAGDSILSDAAKGGYVALVQFLLQVKPDIESPPSTALSCAAAEGHLEIVDIILNHWAIHTPLIDIPIYPIIAATRSRHKAVVMRLQRSMNLEGLVSSGDIDDNIHKHLFLLSASWGWEHLIQKLLDRGCPIRFEPPQSICQFRSHQKK
ncbi:hypothetical protein N7468_000001 [Penicillium chermesinum]|uniref:Uncharacterized protein n=1 Tax=Penicillium chermesinum TaxID=63820 RepID=A0A9W9PJE6_9EURO|nr:uncharacterized protein N7468_000001 [Penicillium chermesinum]KAJ5248550.1 hypothetical protein N7468_000001 [Penicillium chermesinum]